jgi:hypothetical protein
MTGGAEGTPQGWEAHRREQLRAIARGTSPARRLAWLEEALRVALQTHFRQWLNDNLAILSTSRAGVGPWHYTPVAAASAARSRGPSGVTVAGGRTPAAAKA